MPIMHESSRYQVVESGQLADQAEGLLVVRGLNSNLRQQLVDCSKQPHISGDGVQTTDDLERFASVDSVQTRETYGEYYGLVQDGELGGIAWLRKKLPPDPGYAVRMQGANYTFAIRLYENCLGRGMAPGFMSTVLEDFKKSHDDEQKVWLSVGRHNQPAKRLYEKTGWNSIIIDDEQEFMIKCLKRKILR